MERGKWRRLCVEFPALEQIRQELARDSEFTSGLTERSIEVKVGRMGDDFLQRSLWVPKFDIREDFGNDIIYERLWAADMPSQRRRTVEIVYKAIEEYTPIIGLLPGYSDAKYFVVVRVHLLGQAGGRVVHMTVYPRKRFRLQRAVREYHNRQARARLQKVKVERRLIAEALRKVVGAEVDSDVVHRYIGRHTHIERSEELDALLLKHRKVAIALKMLCELHDVKGAWMDVQWLILKVDQRWYVYCHRLWSEEGFEAFEGITGGLRTRSFSEIVQLVQDYFRWCFPHMEVSALGSIVDTTLAKQAALE